MRTNLLGYVLGSEKRRKVFQTLLEYPKRQWICSSLEEFTKLNHAAVFRTMTGLSRFGILRQLKLSRKMVVYELVKSPLLDALKSTLNTEKNLFLPS